MKNTLTERESYQAMQFMLLSYYKESGSNEITDLFGGGVLCEDENDTIDPVFWDYWIDAIEKVKNGEPPLTLNLSKD